MIINVRRLAAMLAAFVTVTVVGMPDAVAAAVLPINDLGTGSYLGFQGGLYPAGRNTMPDSHRAAGVTRALRVRPLDTSGTPSANGKYVLLSIGMSNTTQEFCSGDANGRCAPYSFIGQAAADPQVNHDKLAIVDGAAGGQTAGTWDAPTDANYDRVRDTRLAPLGLTERQVQIAWVKVANANPSVSLPATNADAYQLVAQQGNILRALKRRYPNLQQVFFSSRIYGGYATTTLNPEPYAYETGFGVKWVIQAQITQMSGGGTDPRAGNLDYNSTTAWAAWGPYLWANGLQPRSDGLVWERSDFGSDGTHPSTSGRQKVASLLLRFFKTSPHTTCWFTVGGTCA
ncbi:hypothetical protein ONA91_18170 [Micromonospora sp. DR5-3]|uniref:hypothetical protein n=1 Tax=unclassified Micromonospora TaxID=2617518 RepID=UPI0011DB18EB|nr:MULTISPECIES: hypothetical protein [unclassified Micromonospora]MCW3816374.1 hypothetical protein [Micromonospora sp. DR5-3]TYC22752.1 hypothetical protein FXF52_19060 [Micromonospora sp. MP36]